MFFNNDEEGIGGMISSSALDIMRYNTLVSTSNALWGFGGIPGNTFFQWMKADMFGRRPDVINARKFLGTTWPNKIYANLMYGSPEYMKAVDMYDAALLGGAPKEVLSKYAQKIESLTPGFARFAPSLAHLSPGRHLAMLAAYGGNTEGMAAIREGGSIARIIRMSTSESGVPLGYTRSMMMNVEDLVRGPLSSKVKGLGKFFGMEGVEIPKELSEFMREIQGYSGLGPPPQFEDDIMAAGRRIRGAMGSKDVEATREAINNLARKMGTDITGADRFTLKVANYMAKSGIGRWTMSRGIPLGAAIGTRFLVASNWFSIGMLAGEFAYKAARFGVRTAINTAKLMTEDFRRTAFMSTGGLPAYVGSTTRERALAVMNQTGLALNQVLGNEASYF